MRRYMVELAAGLEPSREPIKFPSVTQKIANFAQAVVTHAAAGFPRLSEEETASRLAVCHECPQFHDRTCILCGCNMKIKASWADQKCPLGKWPELNGRHDAKEEIASPGILQS